MYKIIHFFTFILLFFFLLSSNYSWGQCDYFATISATVDPNYITDNSTIVDFDLDLLNTPHAADYNAVSIEATFKGDLTWKVNFNALMGELGWSLANLDTTKIATGYKVATYRFTLYPIENIDFSGGDARGMGNNNIGFPINQSAMIQIDFGGKESRCGTQCNRREVIIEKGTIVKNFLGKLCCTFINAYTASSICINYGPCDYGSTKTDITTNNSSNSSFHIFPNPIQNKAILSLHNSKSQLIEIYNFQGQLVKQIKCPPNQQQLIIEVSDLPQGTYIIRNHHHTQKISIIK